MRHREIRLKPQSFLEVRQRLAEMSFGQRHG